MVTLPKATPVTTPPLLTVAIAVLPLLQVPPGVASANVVVEPIHTDEAPVIAATTGAAFTEITLVTVVVHPPLVTA